MTTAPASRILSSLFAKSARLLGALALGATLFAASAPLTGTEAQAACVTGVASNDVLNIRSGPSTRFEITGFIRPGECGVVTGQREGNWIWVDYGKGGYVNKRYLRFGGGGGGGGGGAVNPAFRCVVGVASNDVLNVRSGPGASNRIVGQLPPGTCFVEVIDQRGGWYKVSKDGTRGWVNGRYLTN
ncbi:MAG: SH3 domain-containing protein [Pseudomonadota bacterium]